MIQRAMPNCAARRSNRQRTTIELISTSIAAFGRFIYNLKLEDHATIENKANKSNSDGRTLKYLIECRKNIIGELNLCNCGCPRITDANAKANNALFAQRRIKHAISPIFILNNKKFVIIIPNPSQWRKRLAHNSLVGLASIETHRQSQHLRQTKLPNHRFP